MLTTDQFAAQHARTPRKAYPKAVPQGAPPSQACARKPSPGQATTPDEGERAHIATAGLDTTCVGGGLAPPLSSPRKPQHALVLETRPRNRAPTVGAFPFVS